jgi:hypothetical protein
MILKLRHNLITPHESRGIFLFDPPCPINLRGRDAIAFLPKTVRKHNQISRQEIAWHPNLKVLEFEKLSTLNALELLPAGNSASIAHFVEQPQHLRLLRIGQLIAIEVETWRGSVSTNSIYDGLQRAATSKGPLHSQP